MITLLSITVILRDEITRKRYYARIYSYKDPCMKIAGTIVHQKMHSVQSNHSFSSDGDKFLEST